MDGNPITVDEWSRAFADTAARTIKTDLVDGALVSTVWLGLDHSFGDGRPMIFETMVFPNGVVGMGDYCDRYSTKEEAIAGHAKAVEWVKSGTPEKE
jgi:hypothetical protein